MIFIIGNRYKVVGINVLIEAIFSISKTDYFILKQYKDITLKQFRLLVLLLKIQM